MPVIERLLGNIHQSLRFLAHLANPNGNRRIAVKSVVNNPVVETDNIAFAQRPVRRNAVNDLIVDRCTQATRINAACDVITLERRNRFLFKVSSSAMASKSKVVTPGATRSFSSCRTSATMTFARLMISISRADLSEITARDLPGLRSPAREFHRCCRPRRFLVSKPAPTVIIQQAAPFGRRKPSADARSSPRDRRRADKARRRNGRRSRLFSADRKSHGRARHSSRQVRRPASRSMMTFLRHLNRQNAIQFRSLFASESRPDSPPGESFAGNRRE